MSEVKKIATRESYGNALVELGKEHDDVIVLDADLAGATKTGIFQKAFPQRHIDCGIAEGNMMGVAAGLAATGKVPFASSFAMFAAGRAFEALVAAERLAEDGIQAEVINMHTIKPLDSEAVLKAAEKTGKIVTVEEHSVIGGLGSAVCDIVAETACAKVMKIGVNDVFGESGPAGELIKKYELDGESIYKKVKAFVEK